MKISAKWILLLAAALIAGGCGDDKKDNGGRDGGGDDGGDEPFVFEGIVTGDCPEFAERELVEVEGEISEDTTWDCTKAPLLTKRAFVTGGAKLTIEAGTWVFGDKGSALLITKGSQLITKGEDESPVVFTSSLETADRDRGDWGGVVLLGDAPINVGDGTNQVEGIEVNDERGEYGGDDADSNCGSLEYTRIEFAGDQFSIDNELNGLTVAGCGTDTTLSHIQIHKGLDDGIEFFGGTANIDHLVITGAMDDGMDWDEGWTGTAAFVIVQQHPGTGDAAFESDNLEDDNNATPRSSPTIHNVTLVGSNEADGVQTGMVLRRGTEARIDNAIIMGFGKQSVDVRDEATVAGTEGDMPALVVQNSLFFEIGGPDGETWFETEPTDGSEEDDDAGFVESAFFMDEDRHNLFGTDPKLAEPYDVDAPDFAPTEAVEVGGGETTGADFTGAEYLGAIDPDGADWTAGWTGYP
jgi:hypothetical protein